MSTTEDDLPPVKYKAPSTKKWERVRKHHVQKLIRLDLQGLERREIVKLMGLSDFALRSWRRSELYKREYARISADVDDKAAQAVVSSVVARDVVKRIQEGAEIALEYEIGMFSDVEAPKHLKLRAAADLLDRDARTSKKHTINTKRTHEILPPELLAAAVEALGDLKMLDEGRLIQQHVIDVTAEIVDDSPSPVEP